MRTPTPRPDRSAPQGEARALASLRAAFEAKFRAAAERYALPILLCAGLFLWGAVRADLIPVPLWTAS